MKVLVFGASGMIGSAIFRVLSEKMPDRNDVLDLWGTLRSHDALTFFAENLRGKLVSGVDVEKQDAMVRVFSTAKVCLPSPNWPRTPSAWAAWLTKSTALRSTARP